MGNPGSRSVGEVLRWWAGIAMVFAMIVSVACGDQCEYDGDMESCTQEQKTLETLPGVLVRYAKFDGQGAEFKLVNKNGFQVSIGSPADILCGVSNMEKGDIIVTGIQVLATPLLFNDEKLPYDLQKHNLNIRVPSGSEKSIPFPLSLPENRPDMEAKVDLTLRYMDLAGGEYAETITSSVRFLKASSSSNENWRLSIIVTIIIITYFALWAARMVASTRDLNQTGQRGNGGELKRRPSRRTSS